MYDIVFTGQGRGGRNLGDFHVKRMVLSPYQWERCSLPVNLNWSFVKFTKSNAKHIPKTIGVYSFLVQPGIANHPCCSHLVYVGETKGQDFRRRYRQYLREKISKDGRPHIVDMLQKWNGYLWFCYAPINKKSFIDDIENRLLTAYLPPSNKDFPAKVSRALRTLFGT